MVMKRAEVTDWAMANKAILMAGIVFSAGVLYLIFDVNYDQCDDDEDCITIAYQVQDTYPVSYTHLTLPTNSLV